MHAENLSGRLLVDTNVLIYATLERDPRYAQASEVLSFRHRKDITMFISVQNLAEMYPNLTGPKNQPPDPPEVARDKIRAISGLRGLTVLPMTAEIVQQALDLCVDGSVRRQNYFDRQLAALMISENISTILTENVSDFSGIEGLTAINPFT
ncbi:MAG: PIN domain-containing protein [Opitutales bacterium]|nr:PIN domain-containing protein [Opitutales bacterium]MCH8540642.1 PIN domain-containing protein [Opitutales bacterium]